MFKLTSATEFQLYKCLVVEVIPLPLANPWKGRTQAVWITGSATVLHQGCTRARAQSRSKQVRVEQVQALGCLTIQGRSSPLSGKPNFPVKITFFFSIPGLEVSMISLRGQRWRRRAGGPIANTHTPFLSPMSEQGPLDSEWCLSEHEVSENLGVPDPKSHSLLCLQFQRKMKMQFLNRVHENYKCYTLLKQKS